MSTLRTAVLAVAALFALGACEKSAGQAKQAYDVCVAAAKKDARIGKANFASFEESKITGSTGEEEVRVNIPYEFEGKKALYQCIAQKQADGTFKVVF